MDRFRERNASLPVRLRRKLGRLRKLLAGEVRRRRGGVYSDVCVIEGGSLEAGKAYHDIPGERGAVHRGGSQSRADHIASHVEVNGLRGLDIGCSVGGITFGLVSHGAEMTGVDYDLSAIETALRVAQRRGAPVEFVHADLTDDETWAALLARRFDFAVWLSQWMWLAKQAGGEVARRRLRELSAIIPVLVFETAEGPDDGLAGSHDVVGVEGVRLLLEESTVYTSIEDVGSSGEGWLGGRTLFVCRRGPT